MTSPTNPGRRRRYGDRMHILAEGKPIHPTPRVRHHAAYPTQNTGTIVVGAKDICGRCDELIVLTLTGWEHE